MTVKKSVVRSLAEPVSGRTPSGVRSLAQCVKASEDAKLTSAEHA